MQSPELKHRAVYSQFLDFVGKHHQAERSAISRRMFGVFLWCFLIPVVLSGVILVLVNQKILPPGYRSLVDGVIVLFPVVYSLYYLGTQVFSGLKQVVRHGGFSANLHQAKLDGDWRANVYDELKKDFKFGKREWSWIVTNFEADLDRIMTRTRYLTGLAGAVFFLLMQGIDLITSPATPVRIQIVDPQAGIMETMNPAASEWVGLALFLLLLYLSGQQAHQQLARYLPCAKWLRDEN